MDIMTLTCRQIADNSSCQHHISMSMCCIHQQKKMSVCPGYSIIKCSDFLLHFKTFPEIFCIHNGNDINERKKDHLESEQAQPDRQQYSDAEEEQLSKYGWLLGLLVCNSLVRLPIKKFVKNRLQS